MDVFLTIDDNAIKQCLSPYHNRYWRLYTHEATSFGQWSTHLCGSVKNEQQFLKNSPLGTLKNGRNFYCHCSMFLKNYYPDWDFQSLRNGCRWILSFKDDSPKIYNGCASLRNFWNQTGLWLLNMDKGILQNYGICGMMYTNDKLSVWLKDQDDFDTNIKVGIMWRLELDLQNSPYAMFQLKSLRKGKSLARL